MKSIRLIFGTYNSFPACGDGKLPEAIYQSALKPFLTVLNRFPAMLAVLHYSGCLLEWIERVHPEFIMLLADMVKRKQIELITGGFYEPVLTMIPHADRLGQIEHLTTFLRAHFGRRPRGAWLSQCDWEPCLTSMMSTSGVEYTFLDESHFRRAGIAQAEMNYPYMTEDQGKTLTVFPLSQKLRQSFLLESAATVVKHIAAMADESSSRVVSLIHGGEKLGYVGASRKRCYEEGWLQEFLTLVGGHDDVISPVSPLNIVRQEEPRAKIYIPAGTAPEVVEALLPAERAQRQAIIKKRRRFSDLEALLDGGTFRQFLCRYPESNFMYAKMMHTYIRVNQIRGDKYRKKAAREELWKGQSQFGYWHSSKGGIYWPHVRKEHYRAFIEAEKMTRMDGMFTPSIISFDFDMDGRNEYVYQGRDLNAYVHSRGGMLFELDFIPIRWNYGDTFNRQLEFYHSNGDQTYDRYPRKSFMDHFFAEGDGIEDFQNAVYEELGDFLDHEYELVKLNRERMELTMSRDGAVKLRRRLRRIRVAKKYVFRRLALSVEYTVTNQSEKPLDLRFGSELNLSFASMHTQDLAMDAVGNSKKARLANGPNDLRDVGELLLQDLHNGVDISLASDKPFCLWSVPLETVSRSFREREKIYQATSFVPHWAFRLEQGELWTNKLTLSFGRRKK